MLRGGVGAAKLGGADVDLVPVPARAPSRSVVPAPQDLDSEGVEGVEEELFLDPRELVAVTAVEDGVDNRGPIFRDMADLYEPPCGPFRHSSVCADGNSRGEEFGLPVRPVTFHFLSPGCREGTAPPPLAVNSIAKN